MPSVLKNREWVKSSPDHVDCVYLERCKSSPNFLRLQVLYLAVKTLKESEHLHVYDAVEKPLLLAQSAAVLELAIMKYTPKKAIMQHLLKALTGVCQV